MNSGTKILNKMLEIWILQHNTRLFIMARWDYAQSLRSVWSLRPRDCSLPGSSVHGTVLTRILEWVVIFSSRGSFWPWDQTRVSCISSTAGRFFTTELLGKLLKARLVKYMQINPCKYTVTEWRIKLMWSYQLI